MKQEYMNALRNLRRGLISEAEMTITLQRWNDDTRRELERWGNPWDALASLISPGLVIPVK